MPLSTLRALLAVLVLLAAGCAPASVATRPASSAAAQAAPVYPGAAWEHVRTPESAGWSSRGLDSVRARLATLPSTGFMAVAGGRVLMQYGDVDTLTYLASVRKSILSMLMGSYVANGTLRLDRTLSSPRLDHPADSGVRTCSHAAPG